MLIDDWRMKQEPDSAFTNHQSTLLKLLFFDDAFGDQLAVFLHFHEIDAGIVAA